MFGLSQASLDTINQANTMAVVGGDFVLKTTTGSYDAVKLDAGLSGGAIFGYLAGTPSFLISANGDTYFLGNGGNVGIGTNNPAEKLHIVDSSAQIYLDRAGAGTGLYLDDKDGTGGQFAIDFQSGAAVVLQTYDGSWTDTLAFNGGQVGIKDTTPSYDLDVNGTGRFTGAVTTGGSDPPYVQYWAETRQSVIEYVKSNVPPQYLDGATVFYNKDTDQMEMFMASKGEFRSLHTNEVLEKVEPITKTFEVEDEYMFDENTGRVMRWQNPVKKTRYKIKKGYKLDKKTGDFVRTDNETKVSKDKAVMEIK